MQPKPRIDLLTRALDGVITDAVGEWVRDAFRAYVAGAGSLHDCLGLPSTGQATARAVRDYWLLRAADLLEGSPHAKAVNLSAAIRAGCVHENDDVSLALQLAQSATPLPRSAESLRTLLMAESSNPAIDQSFGLLLAALPLSHPAKERLTHRRRK